MKNKKKRYVIIGCSIAIILAVALSLVFIIQSNNDNNTEVKDSGAFESGEIVVDNPGADTTNDNEIILLSNEQIVDDGSGLQPTIEEDAVDNRTYEKVGEVASPIEEKEIEYDEPEYYEEEDYSSTSYSCGVSGHHCDSTATHAYIQNLEIEGCQYCGSHCCPSFYGTDKWGNAGLFPELCPCYNISKDPAYCCQSCGKTCGDGRNGTCVQFVEDCYCPLCGCYVTAWCCHSCS